MNVEVSEASQNEELILRNLFQFYLYEFSRFSGWTVPPHGRFFESDLDGCWTNPKRHPYLIKVSEAPSGLSDGLAGFAIVDEHSHSNLSGDDGVLEMRDFFVMPNFRRIGVGSQAAVQLFELFHGKWEVCQLEHNETAHPFWRKLITDYTKDNYREVIFDDERWRGPVQFFSN